MNIMICGSMSFAKEMIEAKRALEQYGYVVHIPTDAEIIVSGEHDNDDLESDFEHCMQNDIIRVHMKMVAAADVVLFLNYKKNEMNGYVGASSLMEMGLAYYLRKPIFLLYPPPHHDKARWAHEIRIMNPIVLHGDIMAISKHLRKKTQVQRFDTFDPSRVLDLLTKFIQENGCSEVSITYFDSQVDDEVRKTIKRNDLAQFLEPFFEDAIYHFYFDVHDVRFAYDGEAFSVEFPCQRSDVKKYFLEIGEI